MTQMTSSEWAMEMTVHVSLLSGNSASLRVFPYWRLSDLKRAAGRVLCVKVGELTTQRGALLRGEGSSLGEVGLEDGDMLTATARRSRIYSNWSSGVFALVRSDGRLIPWGDPVALGAAAKPSRRWPVFCVASVTVGCRALVALLMNGRVQTFGDPQWGGDCSLVQGQLFEVKEVKAAGGAFTALKTDGTIVTWGQPGHGGCCLLEPFDVRELVSNNMAFVAICEGERGRSVVTWGNAECGGVTTEALRDRLKDVDKVEASSRAFAALLRDQTVVAWGDAEWGGDCSAVKSQLYGIQQLVPGRGFVALRCGGSLVTWGPDLGKRLVQVMDVRQVVPSARAFCALSGDGSVACWGDPLWGADDAAVAEELQLVQRVVATSCAFAAILEDSVVTWGDPKRGGDSASVQPRLRGGFPLQQLVATSGAFAAVACSGEVVAWGDADAGGDCSQVKEQLHGVMDLSATGSAFSALRWDGAVITWGHGRWGGDSSAVEQLLQPEKSQRCDAMRRLGVVVGGVGGGFMGVMND